MEGQVFKTPFDNFKNIFWDPMIDSTEEMGRLFPDAILFGSLILYIITQNVSFGVLSVFFLETSLLHQLIAFVCEKTFGASQLMNQAKKAEGVDKNKKGEIFRKCSPGFRSPRLEFERIFMADKYPSISVFFWGAFVAYMSGSNYSFSEILAKMGQEWWPRLPFAVFGIIILTLLFLLGRFYGCGDSPTEIMLALFTGLICGILLYIVNLNVFGLEAMNFNGLPILVNKTDQGSSIYVCAPPLSST
jgi:hypothetical protein